MTARNLFAAAARASLLALPAAGANAQLPVASAPPPASYLHEASLDEYRAHLQALTTLVEACAKARDRMTCDPSLVGLDDHVPLTQAANAERRLVRYGWLRVLLSKAQDKDTVAPEAKPEAGTKGLEQSLRPPSPTTTQLLKDAGTRLARDLAQTDAAPATNPAYARERETMKQVLAGREFRNLEDPTAKDTVFEKVGNWLNRLFESAARLTAHSAWLGRAIVWGFVLAVCLGLVWGLMQLERRWRIRLVAENRGSAAGSASARDWQVWLADARRAAAAGLWREAIHFVYWASISRLESKRLWPADRARTPREYLALMTPEDPRKAGLATLTGSFERVWYGGRPAAETDYRRAEQIAAALIAGTGASSIEAQAGGAQ